MDFSFQLWNFHGSCLMLYLKNHDFFSGHLGFLLCYLLGVLHFTLRLVIQFEFSFVKGIRSVFRFIFLYVDASLFQHYLLKRLSWLHCFVFAPLSEISWQYTWKCISGLPTPFHWFVCSFANTTLSWLLELCTKSWSWEGVSILILFFCFSIVLTILGLLLLHVNFWINLKIFTNHFLFNI